MDAGAAGTQRYLAMPPSTTEEDGEKKVLVL